MTDRLAPEREQEIREWASTAPHHVSDLMLRDLLAEIGALRADLAIEHAVCLCGCTEHENAGEDGESCGVDGHECLRVAPIVFEAFYFLRSKIDTLRAALSVSLDAVHEAERQQARHARNTSTVNLGGWGKLARQIEALQAETAPTKGERLMPKATLKPEYQQLSSALLETFLAGHKRYRPDLPYPQSHSDMQGGIEALLLMFEIRRRPLALEFKDLLPKPEPEVGR